MAGTESAVMSGERGFSLVEVLVAFGILLLIATAFIPLFVHVTARAEANRARMAAVHVANTEMEYIRSLPYSDVGVDGGNPDGPVERDKVVSREGRQYQVTTDIWWVDDPSDDSAGGGGDPIPYDYKKVEVRVSAPGHFPGSVTVSSNMESIVSQDSGEEAYPGGNIRVKVYRGWIEDPDADRTPVRDVKVVTTGPGEDGTPSTLFTTTSGEALFVIMDEGDYTVETSPGSLENLMVHPDKESVSLEVTDGVTSELSVPVETPVFLEFDVKDAETEEPIDTGTVILEVPGIETPMSETFSDDEGFVSQDVFGEIWPVYGSSYNLMVSSPGYESYVLLDEDPADRPWSGQFAAPGETPDRFTVYLERATHAAIRVRTSFEDRNVRILQDGSTIQDGNTGTEEPRNEILFDELEPGSYTVEREWVGGEWIEIGEADVAVGEEALVIEDAPPQTPGSIELVSHTDEALEALEFRALAFLVLDEEGQPYDGTVDDAASLRERDDEGLTDPSRVRASEVNWSPNIDEDGYALVTYDDLEYWDNSSGSAVIPVTIETTDGEPSLSFSVVLEYDGGWPWWNTWREADISDVNE